MRNPSARETALRTLISFESPSLGGGRESLPVDPRDRALATEIVSTTVKFRLILDELLGAFSRRRIDSLPPGLRNALRMGVCQLLFMRTPPYAAISGTVDCLKKEVERSYCNAVLRSISRTLGHVEMPDLDVSSDEYLVKRFSVPQFIADVFKDRLGLKGAMVALDAANRPPIITLRVNVCKTSRESLLCRLHDSGYQACAGRFPEAIYVFKGRNVTDMPGYAEGLFSVQDEGAMAVGHLLQPVPGDRVWDACSAPGGKATHVAELMSGLGQVLATDVDEKRVSMVDQSVRRLGHYIVSTAVCDVASNGPAGFFDKVLVDAPCSGLGVLRRNPDLRWNRRPEDIFSLARLQRDILDTVSKRVAPKGFLLYSTCTLTRQENEETWEWFLQRHPEFFPDLCVADLPEGFSWEEGTIPGSVIILPGEANDGFFVGRAKKV